MISKIAAPTLVSALLLSGCSGAQTTSNSDVACKEPSPTEYPARYVTAYNAVPGRSSGQAQGQYQLCAHIIDCDANGVTVRFENVTGGAGAVASGSTDFSHRRICRLGRSCPSRIARLDVLPEHGEPLWHVGSWQAYGRLSENGREVGP